MVRKGKQPYTGMNERVFGRLMFQCYIKLFHEVPAVFSFSFNKPAFLPQMGVCFVFK